jgi:DNA invertase Pin-like site-specific DNA recombinase
MPPLIAYYRVSTQKQGRSGLGLEGQRAAVAMFAKAEGFAIVAEFPEIKTKARTRWNAAATEGGAESGEEGQVRSRGRQAGPPEP